MSRTSPLSSSSVPIFPGEINWQFKPFSQLSVTELYDILSLRTEVFIVEQNCPYQDEDGKDKKAIHQFGYDKNGVMVGCLRIFAAGIAYPEASVGRVVNSPIVRRTGLGRQMMRRAMNYCESELQFNSIKISAQSHLQNFYEEFGFFRTPKAEYLEDNIPHVEMLWKRA